MPYVQAMFPLSDSSLWNPRGLDWTQRGLNLNDPDVVFHQAALKSNAFAPRLAKVLHVSGDAGIVTIQGFNGIGPYTGYNLYNDAEVNAVTGEILHDAYQSTASYLAAVAGTLANRSVRQTCDVDGNGVIDRRDVAAIMAARNTAASGLTDPRVADGNGLIDVLDARRCTLVCSFANCASTQ